MDRTCTRCRRTLDEADFNFKNRATGRLHSHCKSCSRALVRDHYSRNTEYYVNKAVVRNRTRRRTLLDRLVTYLQSHPCVDCGEDDPVVLDFDHVDPAQKEFDIASKIKDAWGWRTIEAEIAKCAVRCANCHRRRTARQFGWYRLVSARSLAPVAQLDRAPVFGTGGLRVRSLPGAPRYTDGPPGRAEDTKLTVLDATLEPRAGQAAGESDPGRAPQVELEPPPKHAEGQGQGSGGESRVRSVEAEAITEVVGTSAPLAHTPGGRDAPAHAAVGGERLGRTILLGQGRAHW